MAVLKYTIVEVKEIKVENNMEDKELLKIENSMSEDEIKEFLRIGAIQSGLSSNIFVTNLEIIYD